MICEMTWLQSYITNNRNSDSVHSRTHALTNTKWNTQLDVYECSSLFLWRGQNSNRMKSSSTKLLWYRSISVHWLTKRKPRRGCLDSTQSLVSFSADLPVLHRRTSWRRQTKKGDTSLEIIKNKIALGFEPANNNVNRKNSTEVLKTMQMLS